MLFLVDRHWLLIDDQETETEICDIRYSICKVLRCDIRWMEYWGIPKISKR